jgi:hypothetical protein
VIDVARLCVIRQSGLVCLTMHSTVQMTTASNGGVIRE